MAGQKGCCESATLTLFAHQFNGVNVVGHGQRKLRWEFKKYVEASSIPGMNITMVKIKIRFPEKME